MKKTAALPLFLNWRQRTKANWNLSYEIYSGVPGLPDSMVHDTKTGKIYQMTTKYTK
jgi:hypothetical protein